MYWNGYAGCTGGEGGALGCEGAMRLQWLQFARKAVIAGVMPGQSLRSRPDVLNGVWPGPVVGVRVV